MCVILNRVETIFNKFSIYSSNDLDLAAEDIRKSKSNNWREILQTQAHLDVYSTFYNFVWFDEANNMYNIFLLKTVKRMCLNRFYQW